MANRSVTSACPNHDRYFIIVITNEASLSWALLRLVGGGGGERLYGSLLGELMLTYLNNCRVLEDN